LRIKPAITLKPQPATPNKVAMDADDEANDDDDDDNEPEVDVEFAEQDIHSMLQDIKEMIDAGNFERLTHAVFR